MWLFPNRKNLRLPWNLKSIVQYKNATCRCFLCWLDRRTGLGGEVRSTRQLNSKPRGLERYHAEPTKQCNLTHQSLLKVQSVAQGVGRTLRVPLNRPRPVLLRHVPALQPVRIGSTGPNPCTRLQSQARQTMSAWRRWERDRRPGLHPRHVRQPILQGLGCRKRILKLRPDTVHLRRN